MLQIYISCNTNITIAYECIFRMCIDHLKYNEAENDWQIYTYTSLNINYGMFYNATEFIKRGNIISKLRSSC